KNLRENQTQCPETTRILKQVPNLFQAFFSVLEGGKSILSHHGPYMGYLRYHLGLIVPENDPPSIKILDEVYTWQEGESMIFDDTLKHEVINYSTDIRVVLIVDILRPMPLIPHLINWFTTRFLIKNVYGKTVIKNLNSFKRKQALQEEPA
ncbi:MAG: aspartyl/asparaginyl beta-hydroxylase domain-containing protein, partial [Bacteroidota bacterium]